MFVHVLITYILHWVGGGEGGGGWCIYPLNFKFWYLILDVVEHKSYIKNQQGLGLHYLPAQQ